MLNFYQHVIAGSLYGIESPHSYGECFKKGTSGGVLYEQALNTVLRQQTRIVP